MMKSEGCFCEALWPNHIWTFPYQA